MPPKAAPDANPAPTVSLRIPGMRPSGLTHPDAKKRKDALAAKHNPPADSSTASPSPAPAVPSPTPSSRRVGEQTYAQVTKSPTRSTSGTLSPAPPSATGSTTATAKAPVKPKNIKSIPLEPKKPSKTAPKPATKPAASAKKTITKSTPAKAADAAKPAKKQAPAAAGSSVGPQATAPPPPNPPQPSAVASTAITRTRSASTREADVPTPTPAPVPAPIVPKAKKPKAKKTEKKKLVDDASEATDVDMEGDKARKSRRKEKQAGTRSETLLGSPKKGRGGRFRNDELASMLEGFTPTRPSETERAAALAALDAGEGLEGRSPRPPPSRPKPITPLATLTDDEDEDMETALAASRQTAADVYAASVAAEGGGGPSSRPGPISRSASPAPGGPSDRARSPSPPTSPAEDEYSQGRKQKLIQDLPPAKVTFEAKPGRSIKRDPLTNEEKVILAQLHIKPLPCNFEESDKKKAQPKAVLNKSQADAEKFTNSDSNHNSIAKAVFLIPFDIYECIPFFTFLDSLGLNYATSFPTLEGVQDALDDMQGKDHAKFDVWLLEARKYFDLALAAEQQDDKTGAYKKSVTVFTSKYDPRYFQYPVVQLNPPKESNHKTNAAVKHKISFEKKAKKQEEKKGKKGKGRGKGKAKAVDVEVEASDAGSTSAAPPPPDLEDIEDDWESKFLTDGGQLDVKDLSNTVRPDYRQPRLYGTVTPSEYPPPVVVFYGKHLRHIQQTFSFAFERILRQAGKLYSQMTPAQRLKKIADGQTDVKPKTNYGPEYELQALRDVFGDWAVTNVEDSLSLATGPPGGPPIPEYRTRLERFLTQVKGFLAKNDANHLKHIYEVDKDFSRDIRKYAVSIRSNTVKKEHIPHLVRLFSKYERSYRRWTAPPSTLYTTLATPFWIMAAQFDRMPADAIGALTDHEQNEIYSIQQAYTDHMKQTSLLDLQEQEDDQAGDLDLLHHAATTAATSHQARGSGNDTTDGGLGFDSSTVFLTKDFGVDGFVGWDAWDFIVYLGLVWYQPKDSRDLAEALPKAEAHERERHEDGSYKLDQSGNFIYVNPNHHRARTEVVLPGLNVLEPTPIDLTAWQKEVEEAVKNGKEAVRTPQNHAQIVISVHQLAGLANILARGYLDTSYASNHSGSLLADDVGVGKTLQGLTAMAMIHHYRSESKRYAKTRPPVQAPWKRQWCYLKNDVTHGKLYTPDEVAKMPTRWIGDVRCDEYTKFNRRNILTDSPIRHSLFISTPTVITSQLDEARRFLDPRDFEVVHFSSQVKSDPTKRAHFMNNIDNKAKTKHIVILMSYNTMSSIAIDVSICPDEATEPPSMKNSLLKIDTVWSFMFIDEIHYMRNPHAQQSANLQRFCRKALVTVGATATPIFNGPMDIISILKAMLHPAVRRPVNKNEPKGKTDWIDSVEQLEAQWKKLAKERNTVVANENQEMTEELLTATGSRRLVLIAQRDQEKAEWMREEEVIEKDDTPEVQRRKTARNAWRVKLQSNVIDVIVKVVSPYMIRRTADSIDYLGQKVLDIPPSVETIVRVVLSATEAKARSDFKDSIDDTAGKNFAVLMRQYNLDPHFVEYGIFNPKSYPSAKMLALIKDVVEWHEDNIDPSDTDVSKDLQKRKLVPLQSRTKMIIHTVWTSMVEVIQARLSQWGFYAAVMSGQTAPVDRKIMNDAFQLDEDHLSTPFAFTGADGKLKVIKSHRTRIMIITSVANAGINLFRASHMCLLDHFFTAQDKAQIVGRVARKGQTRKVTITQVSVEDDIDAWMNEMATTKGLASTRLFGQGNKQKTNLALPPVRASSEEDISTPSNRFIVLPQTDADLPEGLKTKQAMHSVKAKSKRLHKLDTAMRSKGLGVSLKEDKDMDEDEKAELRAKTEQDLQEWDAEHAMDVDSEVQSQASPTKNTLGKRKRDLLAPTSSTLVASSTPKGAKAFKSTSTVNSSEDEESAEKPKDQDPNPADEDDSHDENLAEDALAGPMAESEESSDGSDFKSSSSDSGDEDDDDESSSSDSDDEDGDEDKTPKGSGDDQDGEGEDEVDPAGDQDVDMNE